MPYSLIYGEAFRDDDADPRDGHIRVYELADGARYVGHESHDIAHICSGGCLAAWEAALGDDWQVTIHGGSYVSRETDTRPPFTYAQTIDRVDFDPGDDPYILCAWCEDVMVDGRRVGLSSGNFSTDQQLEDAVGWLETAHPDTYAEFVAAFPEWPRRTMGDGISSWFDTEAMGVDVEWPSWCIDWLEDNAPVWWEDGEPWGREDDA